MRCHGAHLQRRQVALGQPELARLQQPAHDLAAARLGQVRARTRSRAAPRRRPADLRANPISSSRSSSVGSYPGRSATKALTTSPATGSGTPITPASATRRVLHQRALDLERADQVPGRLDDVVAAADEPEPAVGVAPGQVAGEVPAAGEGLAVAGLVVEVAAHHATASGVRRASSPSTPGSVTCSRLAVGVEHDLAERRRAAARSPRCRGPAGPSTRGGSRRRRSWRP